MRLAALLQLCNWWRRHSAWQLWWPTPCELVLHCLHTLPALSHMQRKISELQRLVATFKGDAAAAWLR